MKRFWEWARKYKLLLIIYVSGMVFGIREFVIARDGGGVDMMSDEWAAMTDVVASFNPDDPDTEFLLALQELRAGDPEGYIEYFEAALDDDVKHNEFLLQDYTQFILDRGAVWTQVNRAANRWRENFPFSAETLSLPLGQGPADAGEADLIRRELMAIDWVSNATVSRDAENPGAWRAEISFRPPLEVDLREAIAAVSILSVPAADRARLKVTCLTFRDCRVSPR